MIIKDDQIIGAYGIKKNGEAAKKAGRKARVRSTSVEGNGPIGTIEQHEAEEGLRKASFI